MPIVFKVFAFFGSFISMALLVGFFVSVVNNKRAAGLTDKFIGQSDKLNHVIIREVRLRYCKIYGMRITTAPCNFCDLYLFENSLAVLRRQSFIFKVIYAPFIISPDVEKVRALFHYLETYKPDKIIFKSIAKEVEIKFSDPFYERVKTEMTFRNLTNEQLLQLQKMKYW